MLLNPAGLINVTTKAPTDELEGSLELTSTDDDENRVTAGISGPITNSLSYRVSGYWSDLDGYVDNLTYKRDINDSESKGGYGKLRWDISDSVQADLNAHYSKEDSVCCAITWADLDSEARFLGIVPEPLAPGITASDTNRDVRTDDEPLSETENKGASLRFLAGLGEFSLTPITAYNKWEYSNVQDVDYSNVDVEGFFTGGEKHGGVHSDSMLQTDFFSQELRLESPSHERYDYLVGLYYADSDTDLEFQRNVLCSEWHADVGSKTLAVFGQLNWHFSPSTHLIAGLRWNDEDVMLYARYAQGYKGRPATPARPKSKAVLMALPTLREDHSPTHLSGSTSLGQTITRIYPAFPSTVFFNISYTWQDDVNFGLSSNPINTQESYGITSASIGLADASPLFGGKTAVFQNLPRVSQRCYGVRLKFTF